MDIAGRLKELGWALPPAPKPIAAYVPAVRSGNLLFVSGQLPMRDGKLQSAGPVPSAVPLAAAQTAAAQCAVNALAILDAELGGNWDQFKRVVRIGVFVNSDSGFADQAKVANGASELLQQVLGEAGRHARAAVGVNALPLGAAVEAEFLFELTSSAPS
jgi:enamine deaminase RidA (YjgF/YER057c/UK114 family)